MTTIDARICTAPCCKPQALYWYKAEKKKVQTERKKKRKGSKIKLMSWCDLYAKNKKTNKLETKHTDTMLSMKDSCWPLKLNRRRKRPSTAIFEKLNWSSCLKTKSVTPSSGLEKWSQKYHIISIAHNTSKKRLNHITNPNPNPTISHIILHYQ